jgi:hypothetical protein
MTNDSNLEKSRIKVIKPEFVGEVIAAFEKAMRES